MTRTELINYYNSNKNKIIVITTRDGSKYIMINNCLFVNENSAIGLTSNEDLTSNISESYDIMEIRLSRAVNGLYNVLNTPDLPLVWKRYEYTELTMNEISEKFNIPIESLKIKK